MKTFLQLKTGSTIIKMRRKKQSKNLCQRKRKDQHSFKGSAKESNKWKNSFRKIRKMSEYSKVPRQINFTAKLRPKPNLKSRFNLKMTNLKTLNFKTESFHKSWPLYREIKKFKWWWLWKMKTTKWINFQRSRSRWHKNKLNSRS